MLTGKEPINSQVREEVIKQGLRDPLPRTTAHVPDVPTSIADLIHRAMQLQPKDRWQSAAEMREALREEQRRKEEVTRRLAEQQRLAEEARQRALADAERKQREEAERKQRKEDERQQKEAERQQRAEDERRRKEDAERKQREARERELAEKRCREEETRPRNTPLPVPQPSSSQRHKRLAILAGAALLVLLLGYWLWKASHSSESQPPIATAPASALTGTPAVTLSPQPSPSIAPSQSVEVLRYAQKFEPKDNFRLRFTSQRDGYLYLFGLDENDKPITLLTNRHAYDVKAQANRLIAGTESVFPQGSPLSLDTGKPSAPVTLIFSLVELNAPAFLNAAKLHDLTPDEQRALDQLKRQAQARLPKTAPSAEGETMTALPAGDEPLVFEIVLRKQVKGS